MLRYNIGRWLERAVGRRVYVVLTAIWRYRHGPMTSERYRREVRQELRKQFAKKGITDSDIEASFLS